MMPTEIIKLKGCCGREIVGKVWKQGGTAKCPGQWSFNTYPKPTQQDLQEDVISLCRDCESLASKGAGETC